MVHLLLRYALCWTFLTLVAVPAIAQHDPGASAPAVHTFRVDGLRVDEAAPPPGSAVGRAGARFADGGYLHVTYGKPYKRGRTIFGGLVAYDQVWVTGAHMTTELAITVPITVGGQPLDPGVYSLFTTPGSDRWRLHLNTALGTHLTDDYDPDRNVVTIEAPSERLDPIVQALEIEFVPVGEDAVNLAIRWDQTAVEFPIRRR